VGLGVLATGAALGLHQAGYVDRVVTPITDGVCGVLRLPGCGTPPEGTPPETGRHRTGAQPADGGWSGVGQRPEAVPRLPAPLIAGGAAVFVVYWWDIPGRLRRRSRRRHPRPVSPAALAMLEPDTADGKRGGEVTIAGIDPGIAGKGMRVGVRDCEITLRPGPRGTVRLDKTLARTSNRDFALAGRTVRRSLRNPAFVAALIEETGRAAAYLDGNPQLVGAQARRAELTALARALEGLPHGSPD